MSTPPPSDRRIDADEFIAVVVALAAIGGILAWGLRRIDPELSWNILAPTPALVPETSSPTPSPLTEEPAPPVSASPDVDASAADPAERLNRRERPPRAAVLPVPAAEASPDAVVAEDLPEFPDVPTDYWAYPFITGLATQGIVQGLQDGTFRPEAPTTRAQFASALRNTFDLGSRREGMAFSDVPADYQAGSAIDAAVRGEFMRGYPDQTFKPDQSISRLEMLLSLFSGMQLPPAENPEEVLSVYPDAAAIPEYAIPAIAAATQADLVVLPPGQTELQPERTATRAEVASALYQARVLQGEAEPVSTAATTIP